MFMPTTKRNNLFLSQSYADNWQEYQKSLKKARYTTWDYVILTASNEEQAQTYRKQIEKRKSKGLLPKSTHYAVLPDPEGKRVGSGGATLNVLRYIQEQEGTAHPFTGKKIMVIHSGGDSKRVPQYSACGKLFSPVPRCLADGRRSTLFDEFLIAMSVVPARMKDGMLVLSGDVLLLFNPLQIDFQFGGAAAISMTEDVETGKDHGVFLPDGLGNVQEFLHKCSVEELTAKGAVRKGKVDIDTGAVLLGSAVLDALFSVIAEQGTVVPEKLNQFVNDTARLSFYGDFLYPLAKGATLEEYYKQKPEGDFCPELQECRSILWETLHPYPLRLFCLSPAEFIHFGTTTELLELVTEDISQYSFLGWEKQVMVNAGQKNACATNTAWIDTTAQVDESSYIEDSYLFGNTVVGKNCVLSNVVLRDAQVPDNTVLHGLRLKNGKYIVRTYDVSNNPKEGDFWNRSSFAVCSDRECLHPTGETMSLCESFQCADTEDIMTFHEELEQTIQIHNFVEALRRRESFPRASVYLGNQPLTEEQIARLCQKAEESDYSTKARIYCFLYQNVDAVRAEHYEALYLNAVRQIFVQDTEFASHLVCHKEQVEVALPVRVNWGGGWTDTPPYCNENGGAVLNAAVRLRGELPIRATARRIPERVIALASEDAGDYKTFSDIGELQDCHNPFDPFALHKAVLFACGVLPQYEDCSLEDLFDRIGGGVYLSTKVLDIPRGSGLGTSSILAAACVKAISDFFGMDVSEDMIFDRVLCAEQIMSTGGGWQDQVGGYLPGIKWLTSRPGAKQELKIEQVSIEDSVWKELNERFVLVYTGQRRLARNILREIIGKYVSNDPETISILDEIQRIAVLMKFELEKGDLSRFAQLMNQHWELSKKLDSSCTNTCIEQIFQSCEDLTEGRFICGAGGGGFLQVLLKKGVSAEQLQQRVHHVFGESGVDVWDCEFYQ